MGMMNRFRVQTGQTIVEFAFMLPLLMIIIVGIIDFSILFYDKAVVTNASREGARQGSVLRSNPGSGAYIPLDSTAVSNAVTSYISSRALSFGATTPSTVTNWTTTTPAGAWSTNYASAVSGGMIKVTVTYTYTFLAFPRLAGWNGTTNLTAETVMRME
jgi:Flp pilus assembly protein TadG